MERLRETHCPHKGKWTAPEKLHVTLVFLGNVETSLMPSIESAASGIRVPAFDLRLDWLHTAPGKGMVWLAPRAGPPELFALVDALKSSLTGLGLEIERRAYRPHVTLIRKLTRPFVPGEIEPVHWPVRSFALVESRPSPRGSEYIRVRVWRLRK